MRRNVQFAPTALKNAADVDRPHFLVATAQANAAWGLPGGKSKAEAAPAITALAAKFPKKDSASNDGALLCASRLPVFATKGKDA